MTRSFILGYLRAKGYHSIKGNYLGVTSSSPERMNSITQALDAEGIPYKKFKNQITIRDSSIILDNTRYDKELWTHIIRDVGDYLRGVFSAVGSVYKNGQGYDIVSLVCKKKELAEIVQNMLLQEYNYKCTISQKKHGHNLIRVKGDCIMYVVNLYGQNARSFIDYVILGLPLPYPILKERI